MGIVGEQEPGRVAAIRFAHKLERGPCCGLARRLVS